MVNEITNATRVQYLTYWTKAGVNVRPSGRSGPARVAERVLNPTAPVTGSIVVDGAKGSGVLALSLDSARKVLTTLERLEAGVSRALNDGVTLAGDTQQASYYSWQNTSVTSGASNASIGAYDQGNRTNSIQVTSSYGLVARGVPENLVDGSYANDAVSAVTFKSGDAQGQWVSFDFGSPRVIHEATWNSLGGQTQGTWVWQGSNDGSTYFSLGDSFSLGGQTTQVQDTLRNNTDGYQHYRLYGISGTTHAQAQQEVTFKFIDAAPAPATVARNLSAASLNVIDRQLAEGKGAIDNLVSAAESFGINLLSSTSRTVTVRASAYGGQMSIQPQPMDTRALGLTGARALTQAEAEQTLQALQNAIAATQARIGALRTVSNSLLVGQGTLSGEFAQSSAILPPGSLVNLLA